MYKELRQAKIIELLRVHRQVSVQFLSSHLDVTKETIRRDLSTLQNQGLVIRHHGGVSLKNYFMQNNLSGDEFLNVSDLMQIYHSASAIYKNNGELKNMVGKVCVFGSFNVDIVAKVNRFPKNGETLIAKETTFGPGGKGANQALAAHSAGARVHFATKVGKDQFNQFAKKHFESSGMESFTIYESEESTTGSAVIYVNDDGENFIAIYPGANQLITSEEITKLIPYLEESKILLVQLENNLDAVDTIIKLAKRLGVKIILNPAPYTKNINDLLIQVDIITPNETEASAISGIDIFDITSAKKAAGLIYKQGVKNVIITMGKKGSLFFGGTYFYHIPSYNAVAIDTTGAGDAFNGALAASLAKGKNILQSICYASSFASLAVEKEGAANMPSDDLVEARMLQQNISINKI